MDNSKAVLGASVDRLAVLLASIKELTTEADAIKSALIVAGPDVVEGIRERMAQAGREIAEARERRIREAAEEHQRRIAEEQEDLLKWRSGEDVRRYFAATALRVNEISSKIETTHGAEIPIEHAVRVWPLLCRVKRAGADIGEFYGYRLGHYALTNFDGETLTVGCHEIPWSELAQTAAQLGLPAYEPAKEAA